MMQEERWAIACVISVVVVKVSLAVYLLWVLP
jgi:hypothetical protein